ncbi:MAG: SEC-C domain-containing protein [Clostridia bacterium]|nr:SEC-C domain-containing protein [Clostridia bacterium]
MSLYKEWDKLMSNQTDKTIEKFWAEYSGTETRIYKHILENPQEAFEGKYSDLVEKFEADPVIFMGFLDGIQTSLNNPFDLEKVKEDSDIKLDIDFEKLYFNMFKADAEYLYTLEAWEGVLSEEKRAEIYKDFKRSRTVHVEKTPGRNDPCPCGSGLKYKKCCGKNA